MTAVAELSLVQQGAGTQALHGPNVLTDPSIVINGTEYALGENVQTLLPQAWGRKTLGQLAVLQPTQPGRWPEVPETMTQTIPWVVAKQLTTEQEETMSAAFATHPEGWTYVPPAVGIIRRFNDNYFALDLIANRRGFGNVSSQTRQNRTTRLQAYSGFYVMRLARVV